MNRRMVLLLLLLATGLLASIMQVALADNAAVRRAAQKAETLVARNDFNGALESLTTVNCKDNDNCQALVYFTYGWVYETWSDKQPKQNKTLLKRALKYYQRASTVPPPNTRILTNLALVAHRLGDYKSAVNAMTDVIRLRPENAYQSYLFLGEIRQAEGDNKRALAAYKSAIKVNTNDARGHQHLLELYRKTKEGLKLYEHSLGLRLDFPDLAATGFEYAINLLYKTETKRANQSLTRWTAIRSDLGALSTSNLKQLPVNSWKSAGLRQLIQVVRSKNKPPSSDEISWWNKNMVRQDAISRLLRFKASRSIASSESTRTRKQNRIDAQRNAIDYLNAAVDVAPKYYSYLRKSLAGSSNARLDAATDLVALHHSLKTGDDPQGLSRMSENELSEMTNVLFSGKGAAYAAGQLQDIQRFHTVLGMIYYETRRDKSSGADNATFQLKLALKTAERIASQNPEKYQPLPELHTLLAEVYQRQGKTADSAHQSLKAAMGYLEKDNLPQASKALVSAKQRGAKTQKTTALSTILLGRQAIQTRGASLVKTKAGSSELSLDPKIGWLVDASTLKLPKRFIEGQRFKTLADLGNQLPKTGDNSVTNSINSLALEAASKNRVLTSPTDVKRIQRLETNFKSSKLQTSTVKPIKIEVTRPKPSVNTTKYWTLPSKQGTLQIQIDPQILTKNIKVLDKEKIQHRLKIDQNKLQLSPITNQ